MKIIVNFVAKNAKRVLLLCPMCVVIVTLQSQPRLFAQTYNYDFNGRLTGATYANSAQVQYSNDPAGNISAISSSTLQNTNAPVVAILTPSPGSTTTFSPLAITGTASGANQVIFFLFQVNDGPFQTATPANNRTNWTASAALVPGTNLVTVFAQDVAGNMGSNRFSVIFAPPPLWTPTQLGTNLSLWLDAANTNSLTLNGTSVAQWNDLSGNGNNVSSSSSSTQPIYIPATANNPASLLFDGSSSQLLAATNTLAAGTNSSTIYSVGSIAPNATGWRALLFYGSTAEAGFGRLVLQQYGNQLAEVSTFGPNLSLNNNWSAQPSIVGAIFTVPYLYGNFDGGPFYNMATTLATSPDYPLCIGNVPNAGTYWWGNIYEIVAANSALGTNQTQELEGYLAWKWGLQTNLPSNHPYRYAAPLTITTPAPSINASFVPGLGLQVQFAGAAGYSYILQTTTSLLVPINWQPIATNSADSNGNWQFTDTNSVAMPARFYRVVLSQ